MKLTLEKAKRLMKNNNGNLNLSCSTITELPNNLIVPGFLDVSNTQISRLPNNLIVGRWLDISLTSIEELPDNFTVGSTLFLNCNELKRLPENLVIGGCLFFDCPHIDIKDLPNSLKVGCSIFHPTSGIFEGNLKNGSVTKNYIFTNGVLTHVKKAVKKGKYIYYVGKIKGKNVIYDVERYAHCSSFKEGIKKLNSNALEQ